MGKKKIVAWLGLALLLIPWLVSIAAGFQTDAFLDEVMSNSLDPELFKPKMMAIAFQYLFSGVCALFGIGILGACVDGLQYHPKWLFVAILVLGLMWLWLFPYGSLLGLALVLYAGFMFRRFH